TNTCPPTVVLNGATYKQEATWSRETDEAGRPKVYNCCVRPQFEPRNGECVPSCLFLMGPESFRCKETCCPKAWGLGTHPTLCQAGACVGSCSAGYHECGSLVHTCCPTNWKCCNVGLCCGP